MACAACPVAHIHAAENNGSTRGDDDNNNKGGAPDSIQGGEGNKGQEWQHDGMWVFCGSLHVYVCRCIQMYPLS